MKKLLLILAIVLLLAGVGLLLFPTVSNFAGTKISQAQTDKYEERLKHVVPGMTRDDAVKQGIINEKGEYIMLGDRSRYLGIGSRKFEKVYIED